MNPLRWILGIALLPPAVGYVALFIFSNGFRKSFGASENSLLLAILPLAAFGLLISALVWPANRTLLHLGAATSVVLMGFCAWQIARESATVLWLGILYLVLWLIFYGLTLGQRPLETRFVS